MDRNNETADPTIESDSVYWPGILKEVPRSKDFLTPIYEALTNSLEAIKPYDRAPPNRQIDIDLHFSPQLAEEDWDLEKIVISDNGTGIDSKGFERVKKYRDDRKGYSNRGTGRLQFLHFFDESVFESYYVEGGVHFQRKFKLSTGLLNQNILISDHRLLTDPSESASGTKLQLLRPNDNRVKVYYGKLSIDELAERIRQHYILELVSNRSSFPMITIRYFLSGDLKTETSIDTGTIPLPNSTKTFPVEYMKYHPENDIYERTGRTEAVQMTVFLLDPSEAKKNTVKITSKGQVSTFVDVSIPSLPVNEIIGGKRFLVLLASSYFDMLDGDARGESRLKRASELRRELLDDLLAPDDEFIDLDEIESESDVSLNESYPEIAKSMEKHKLQLNQLKEMFLLDDSVLGSVKIGANDTEEKILEKFYVSDSKLMAKRDADIKKQMDSIGAIDPTAPNYLDLLGDYASRVVKAIPLQSRTALTHYVARRKLVLELFEKALDHSLDRQKSGDRNIDEKILHNIIFQQHSTKPGESDLWLLSEEFLFFKGTSELKLRQVRIGDELFFREDLTPEEIEHIESLDEKRFDKRPDILLFPEEGKCIIIELKNPKENISDHLTEITRYASLIFGFAKPKFDVRTFYGYLIGQAIDPDDVREQDSDFREAPKFGYLFRNNKPVVSKFSHLSGEGALYTEVIGYRALLERAKVRNKMFIEKLIGTQKT